MQTLFDFITLKIFITPYIILLVYWFGAFVVPLVVGLFTWWLYSKVLGWVNNSILEPGATKAKELANRYVPWWVKPLMAIVFLSAFLVLEIIWRMIFEFIIAYYQIRDALVIMAS